MPTYLNKRADEPRQNLMLGGILVLNVGAIDSQN